MPHAPYTFGFWGYSTSPYPFTSTSAGRKSRAHISFLSNLFKFLYTPTQLNEVYCSCNRPADLYTRSKGVALTRSYPNSQHLPANVKCQTIPSFHCIEPVDRSHVNKKTSFKVRADIEPWETVTCYVKI